MEPTPIHVRHDGYSLDLTPKDLRVQDIHAARKLNDKQLKQRVARYLEVKDSALNRYVVDRPDSGHLIVRPPAVYG